MVDSLLDETWGSGRLLDLEEWTRTRGSITSRDPDTNAPSFTTSVATIEMLLVFSPGLRLSEELNLLDSTKAYALADPGTFQPGDVLSHPIKGSYVVLEEFPKNYGSWERVELRVSP